MTKNAPRAGKGCLKGTWKAKFALKRVPRDPFGQIWFAFSFIVLEKGSQRAKVGSKGPKRPQNGSKWAKIGSKWAKMCQNWVKMAQNGVPLAPLAIWSTGHIKAARFSLDIGRIRRFWGFSTAADRGGLAP